MNKICAKCKKLKPIEDFKKLSRYSDGRDSWCNSCHVIASRLYRENNRETVCKKASEAYKKDPERLKKNTLRWQKANPKEYYESIQRWRKANPLKIKEYQHKCYKKRAGTPMGQLNNNLSSAIGHSLGKRKGGAHWEGMVGYTLIDLKVHLEGLFEPWMGWNNYGKWHVDHIVPIDSFNYETALDPDFKKCWELSNLQPLEAIENMRKGNRMNKGAMNWK